MTAPLPFRAAPRGRPLAGIPYAADTHLRLGLFAVAAHLLEVCTGGDRRAALDAFPFLGDYADEIAALLGRPNPSADQFRTALREWETAAGDGGRLPLLALRRAGVGAVGRELLLAAGLIEEDPRFADLFEQATGRDRQPTSGLLLAWWHGTSDDGGRSPTDVRAALRLLHRGGLIQVAGHGTPRSEWLVAVPAPVWDSLRGQSPDADGIRHVPRAELTPLADFVAAVAVGAGYRQVPELLAREPSRLLVVRGPAGNGRRTLVGGIAHALGRDLLIGDAALAADPGRWRSFGALAVTMHALPMIELPLGPGETRVLPALPFASLPFAVTTGARGRIATEDDRPVLTIERSLPDAVLRRALWQRAAPAEDSASLDRLAAALRLGSGTIARCGRTAAARAALEHRSTLAQRDVREAARSLGAARLEALATRVATQGCLDDLALDDVTREELGLLATQCRHRESLADAPFEPEPTAGVRALLAGPSGTGKTLAARLLAASLGKDLYRINLAANVSKYIGETEKNLDAAFAAAEKLDIVLLLDEGDALMTARTDVGSSNDRYANLETNFLLQRVEAFGGILLVTTNAADRIDRAFARRMDVVIHFRPPDEQRRDAILRLHLGRDATEAAIEDVLLREIAWRCALTGGQLRNVVQHARLLALDAGRPISDDDLRSAVRREYRKAGAPCPLKPAGVGR